MSLEDVEAILIQKALARYTGNVSHASNALGLSRSALYRPAGTIQPLNHLPYARRILLFALAAGFGRRASVALILSMVIGELLRAAGMDPDDPDRDAVVSFAFSAQGRVVFPLRTLSNLLAALREGDFSISRARCELR